MLNGQAAFPFNLDFINNKSFIIYATLLLSFWVIYFIVANATKNSHLEIDQKRRVIARARGIFIFLTLVSFMVIWADEIYSLIISITAVAAALAIATKELLLCIAGTFYKTSTRPFTIGDRIEVNGIRGDIIDIGVMATQILEVGPGNLTHQYTGRSVTIPNSIFLNHNIINESYSTDYVLHVFEVPVEFNRHWERHQDALLKAAVSVCEVHIDKAKLHFQKIARKRQMESPIIEPRVTLKVSAPDEIIMIVRVTVPARSKGRVEQEILKKYLCTVSKENLFELSTKSSSEN